MALGITKGEYEKIQECWNKFISLVREKLDTAMVNEHRELGLTISEIDMLKKTLLYKSDQIALIFKYKKLLTDISPEIGKKLDLLEVFDRRNNLDNDLAVETFKSIINDETLLDKIETKRETVLEKRDQLYKKMLDTVDIINGKKFTYELILEYINEFGFTKEEHNMILFAGFDTIVKNIEARKQAKNNTSVPVKDEEEIIDVIDVQDEKEKDELALDTVILKYEAAKDSVSTIINKYYEEINDASPETKAAYYAYASYENDEINDVITELQYDETKAKVQVIKLIQKQRKIDEDIAEAKSDSTLDGIYASIIDEEVEEYIEYTKKLMLLEQKIVVTKTPEILDVENSKLFFLTDDSGNLLIPNEIIGHSRNLGTFKTFEDKVNSGNLLRRQGSRIIKMKGVDDCESWINKTIFMQMSGSKPIISYVKVNLINEDNPDKSKEGIAIITACLPKPNIIKESTREILKANREYVCSQLEKIQHKDPEELKRQALIRDNLFGNVNTSDDLSDVEEQVFDNSDSKKK